MDVTCRAPGGAWQSSLLTSCVLKSLSRAVLLQARMEPLGIIVFSCIMGTAGFSVILEATRQLLNDTQTLLPYEGIVVGEACLACKTVIHARVVRVQL